jgi:EAL and modified HD-GYP domain-containing signal transduction protein
LDHVGRVFGYELLYRARAEATECTESGDLASARVLTDAITTLGLDALTGGRPAFINFTRNLLLSGGATLLLPANVVIELHEDIRIDSQVIEACRGLNDLGYALGLDDFTAGSDAEVLMPYVKFVKVDVLRTSVGGRAALAARLLPLGICLIAEKVETAAIAAEVRSAGYRLLQGYYFCRPSTFSATTILGRRGINVELLGALNREDLNVAQLEELVKRDVSLSYRVLRSINSSSYGLRREVTSIRQALVLLGRDQVRKWASVWTLADLNSNGTQETISVALLRARSCELLGNTLAGMDGGSNFFLLGLCSVVDAILGRPMADVLAELPLPVAIKDALLGRPNQARGVLDAVIAYEQGAWDEASKGLDRLDLPVAALSHAYREALIWARELPQTARAT